MPRFLIIFLSVYILMNSYLFWKTHRAFPKMGKLHYVLALFFMLMLAGPIVVRLADRAAHPHLANVMGVVVHTWLAVTHWFFCLGIVLDMCNLAVRGVSRLIGAVDKLVLRPRLLLAVGGVVVAAATIWGFLEARDIQLQTLVIKSDKLAPGSRPIRIVQISDMHFGGGTADGRLAKVLRVIEQAKPDIIVSTGDMVDSPYENIKDYAAMLARVTAPLGKYSIPGNHEYHGGLEEAVLFNKAAGFEFLIGRSVQVAEGFFIAGADDRGRRSRRPDPPNPLPINSPDASRCFVLLLKHRPQVPADSLGQFDLQLSGHTHGGQIFPFGFVIAMIYKYDRGHYRLDKGSELYVSRGTGTWGPPMRLGSPPEVTLIIVEPAKQDSK